MTAPRAEYLLRLDDLCPTLRRRQWERFLPLLAEYRIQPILAVVPDNQDEELICDPPAPLFWKEMRNLEAAGATIGLHGYRHRCAQHGRSLVPLHRITEFAGAKEAQQREWICEGLKILRSHGLDPKIWVAPRHGFDRITLRVLLAEGVGVLSDGFARLPFQRGGVTWIPQQLWEPVEKTAGLWTICMHPNTAADAQVENLKNFLRQHAGQFTSVDRVLAEYSPIDRGLSEILFEAQELLRIRASRLKRQLKTRN